MSLSRAQKKNPFSQSHSIEIATYFWRKSHIKKRCEKVFFSDYLASLYKKKRVTKRRGIVTNKFAFKLQCEATPQKKKHYKTMRKQHYLSNKSLKLDALKWIAVLSKKGFTLEAKNKNFVTIRDRYPLNSNYVFLMISVGIEVNSLNIRSEIWRQPLIWNTLQKHK